MLEPDSYIYSPTNPTMSPSAENYSSIQIIGSPNKCNSEYKYSNPLNMNPEVYSNMTDITLQNNPVSTNTRSIGAQRNVCAKKVDHSPVITHN